ncbi:MULTISPECIES: phosphate ABC transporter permease PstA [Pelosinus]|uniref:Phosphate transport system permease protein PstA n=1 Tax=Pelosinus fermentans B4 TaxID=1149862 RepID=I9LG74_9FIRM|nr:MULTISPECIES: phosphate ABC transporter permease PstA [Pelosinus]EIW19494.1 phosphate ABC transporter, inner membrane subunit PstA [Pelosinus fermentans B4]EIW24773.1 phosphate ABC transporter, inner membrane subunit PstA [Pelosinus fermentans A11]OAM95946.1 phosphate ABC transporter, inner membrane subunit PstA [Pelosinus fermentans DSM 17108]SDR34620.1 phosphate ABC transporter membrane protein 2, PhoT family [Pelosinus fermentans]
MSAKVFDKLATLLMWLAGIVILGILAAFLLYILYKGVPVLSWDFIFGKSSDIQAGGGVGAQLFNSFYILFLSLLVSIPLAIGAGVYLAEYARDNKLTDLIRLSTESLATVPSIVLGLFGMIIFVNALGMGFSIIGGALTLMLLNLPVLVRVTEESVRNVPVHYREASLALGATKWQTIWRVVLPNALPGIITGVTLTAGRALGETAILIFTAGTTVGRQIVNFDVTAAGETLAVHLWYVMAVGLVPDRVEIANGSGALLIITILILNLLFTIPSRILQRKLGAGGH